MKFENQLSYVNNGFQVLKNEIDDISLEKIRNIIEKEFCESNYPSIMYPCISNRYISDILIDCIFIDKLKLFMNDLSCSIGEEVLIFPMLEIMRNYFSCPALGRQGWHSDCNGELKIIECKSLLKKRTYCFGKIGIYLQKNTDFGGQIDLIPKTHLNIRNDVFSLAELSLKISNQLLKLGFGKINLSNQWVSDMVVLNRIKINVNPLDLVLFDSGIIHRGTPLNLRALKEIKEITKYTFDEGSHLNGNKVNLKDNNKYAIYLQFGTIDGLKSYYIDRSKRTSSSFEFELWNKHYDSDSFSRIPSINKSKNIFEKIINS